MKVRLLIITTLLISLFVEAQVGIGTTNPQGALDVVSTNLGFVAPRVTSIDDVTDGNGNPAVDGTIVFDISRQETCFKIAGSWICIGKKSDGTGSINIVSEIYSQISNYIKASNTETSDQFGFSVSLSSDGFRLAVGANNEDSNASGINGNQNDNSASSSGAVYVFRRTGTTWSQEAYIKASNPDSYDSFGSIVSLSSDGSRLAVGANYENSNATGINGNQTDNNATNSGAVYVFSRTGTTWSQEAYIKASNSEASDQFGNSVSLSDDGSRLAVGANYESSNATGINGNQNDNSANRSGAVYLFSRIGTTWLQEAYIKASNTGTFDQFGGSLSLSGDSSRLVVGAIYEDSNATGINGDQNDNSASGSGAVYVFRRSGTNWFQEAYVKASNTEAFDQFGSSVSLSSDGSRLAVGAVYEDSNATGINGNQNDNSALNSGAVYTFRRSGTNWYQEAYIKAFNSELNDNFGYGLSLSGDSSRLVVGATYEDSNATGINGDQNDNSASNSGATYLYTRNGFNNWRQETYIKASNTGSVDYFGRSLSLNSDGSILAIAAYTENSNATGINGDQSNNSASNSGAVYIIE